MFQKVKNAVVSVVAGLASAALPVVAHAGLSAADLSSIQTSITGADTNYYLIGGTILTVIAGIWGFKKVVGLLGR